MTENKKTLDLICMGRAAVDLYSEQVGATLEDASTFAKYVGGCPANIAIGTARLGLQSALLSRVGNEAMGRFVRQTLISEQVDVSNLKTDNQRLTGLVLLGINPPDEFPLIFYRENCADMAISSEDISAEFIASAKALLVSGTHCSQNKPFEATKLAIQIAKEHRTQVILDIDYRPVLWGAIGHGGGEERYVAHAVFAERMSEILPMCDVIVGTEEEILAATNKTNIKTALLTLKTLSSGIIVQKRGEKGCIVHSPTKQPIEGSAYTITVLNVLGAGDAFMSGFLRGYLRDASIEQCCNYGNANGALVVTRHGCSPAMPYWEELQFFMENSTNLSVVERMHHSLKRRRKSKSLCLLAFDHRKHFEELSEKYASASVNIPYFKYLIYQSLQSAPNSEHLEIGMIVDGKYGSTVLKEGHRNNIYTSRCIESPNSFPLHFIDQKEAAAILKEWPKNQTVKVLCYVDQQDLQINSLKQLYEATNQTGHQLLIELIDQNHPINLVEVERMIRRCYDKEIFPTWWKLQPIDDDRSWKAIESTIQEIDPHMSGVLLLGENRPLNELSHFLTSIATKHPIIKGFAIGRTVWGNTAEKWFTKQITDREAVEEIATNFNFLVNHWMEQTS